jgi:hypothetical protein
MAIRFLDAIDLTGLEMTNVLAQNLPSNPTTALGEGQFIYDTTLQVFKYYAGSTKGWIALDGQGGVTSVSAGKGLSASATTGAITISPDYSSATNIILSATNLVGTVVPVEAHIIYSDNKNVVNFAAVQDLPFTANTGTVTGVSGTAPIVSSGGTSPAISINDFTGANGSAAGTKGAVPAPAAADNVKYLKGDGTWATIPSGFAGFDISDGKNSFAVASGNGVTFASAAGTIIFDAATALTVNADLEEVSSAIAGAYTSANITIDKYGRVTAAATGGAGTMSSFKAAGDTGTAQSIGDGDTLTIAGSTGIDTVASATGVVTVNLDLCELDAPKGDIDPTKDTLAGCFGSANGKVVIDTIPLSAFAKPGGNLDMNNKKIVDMADPTSAQDASTKNYVDTTFAGSGSLIYQGGYDATTAAPTTASTKKGFTYAVTKGGTGVPANFWSPALEIGDLIIANIDNPTSAADWTEINKNIDVATATVQGIANFPTAGGLSVTAGAVSIPVSGVKAATYGASDSVSQITVDDKGLVTGASDVAIAIDASQVNSFCTEVVSCQTAREKTGTIGNATSWQITHNFGTRNVMVQVYSNTTPYDNVEVKIARSTVNIVDISVAKNPGASALNYMIQKIG